MLKKPSFSDIFGRENFLFSKDFIFHEKEINQIIQESSFLILGAAGTIGRELVKLIFQKNPKKLHAIDINENNLAELVRDLRSSKGYISGEFKTFVLDINSYEYDSLIESDGKYDYVFNLSALKHVRSEKDPFSLMRMVQVNILNTEKTLLQASSNKTKKYFSVSSDKATNPVNLMGASKKIMEDYLKRRSSEVSISTARFPNVAFSDGSLLHSFENRIKKKQPIVAPTDVKRYFIDREESAELCLLSAFFGENRDNFIPKINTDFKPISFDKIAIKYLECIGFEPFICSTEEEAREKAIDLIKQKKWACYFSQSNTTGEKIEEEFYSPNEIIDWLKFESIGIIKNDEKSNTVLLNKFEQSISEMKKRKIWTKEEIVELFFEMIPNFDYEDKKIYLDSKM